MNNRSSVISKRSVSKSQSTVLTNSRSSKSRVTEQQPGDEDRKEETVVSGQSVDHTDSNRFNCIFDHDRPPHGCLPVELSAESQAILLTQDTTDDDRDKRKHYLVDKAVLLTDIEQKQEGSDLFTHQAFIANSDCNELLLLIDGTRKFGSNFVLVGSEELKAKINGVIPSNASIASITEVEKEIDAVESEESMETTDENEEEEKGDDEVLESLEDSILNYKPIYGSLRQWVDLGSDKELVDDSVFPARSQIVNIFQRPTSGEGRQSIHLADRLKGDKNVSVHIAPTEDRTFTMAIMELDKAVSNADSKSDHGTNTEWCYPRNAFTQYEPIWPSPDELQQLCAWHGPLRGVTAKHLTLFEQGFAENIMFDFLGDDLTNLATGDDTYDSRADNTFKELYSLTDLKSSKDKAVGAVHWHPSIPDIVGASMVEKVGFDQRMATLSKVMLTPTYIMLWSLLDPLQPQLLLQAPDDIECFQFNPTDPSIVVGGCFNGMVVVWSIEAFTERLLTVKARIKLRGKPPLFSFDDTDPNKVPVVNFCCLSSIESSHTMPIMDLRWIPAHIEVNRMGYCLENLSQKCCQFITAGLNSELLFWDMNTDKANLVMDRGRESLQSGKGPDKSRFDSLDMKWKPFLRVHLFKTEPGGDHAPTRFCMRENQGNRNAVDGSADDKQNTTARGGIPGAIAKPIQSADTNLYVGTEDGDLVYVDWIPQKDQETGKMQTPKPKFYACQHDGPICYLGRNPGDPSVLLLVGGGSWSLWKEGIDGGPVLESGFSVKPLTGAIWSPIRPAVFFILRSDGYLEAWDLLEKTHEPIMVQSISAHALTAITLHHEHKKQLTAIGDVQGTLKILKVPHRLIVPVPNELTNFVAYVQREVARREFVAMRWNLREQEKIQQEAEQQRVAGVRTINLTTEEMLIKEKEEYDQYLLDEHSFLRQLGVIQEAN